MIKSIFTGIFSQLTTKKLSVVIISFTLLSCTNVGNFLSKPRYLINEIIIQNDTNRTIESAQIKVEKFNRFFSCSYIISKASCSTSFPARPYKGNQVVISWVQNGRTIKFKPLIIPVAEGTKEGVSMKGIVRIKDKNTYVAYFEF